MCISVCVYVCVCTYSNYQKLKENSSAYEPFRLITKEGEIAYLSIWQAARGGKVSYALLNVLIFSAER